MKKIILFVALLICTFIVNAQTFTFQVKDGKGNTIEISRPDANGYFSKLEETFGKEKFNDFAQCIIDRCKNECKYPITFVPTFIGFYFKDTISLTVNDEQILLYGCEDYIIEGYAKNSMGVECEINQTKVLNRSGQKPQTFFNNDLNGKFEEYTFYIDQAPIFITQKYEIVYKAKVDFLSNVYNGKTLIPFEYKGWEYYIIVD